MIDFAILNCTTLKTNIPLVKIGGWKMSFLFDMVRFEVTRHFLGGSYVHLLFEVSGSRFLRCFIYSETPSVQLSGKLTHASPNTNTTNPIQIPRVFPCFDVFLSDDPVHEQRCGDEILRSFWEGEKTEALIGGKRKGAMNHLK